MVRPLKLPAFRRLFAAYTLNELTYAIGSLALALLVYQRTHTAAGTTGFFLASQVLPSLLAPFLVARVDGIRPDRLLPSLYAGEAVAFGILVYLTSHFSVAAALAVITVDGTLALCARSVARTAGVAVTTPHGLLREGNALLNAVFSVCFMGGPALGAGLVAIFRVRGALTVNVAGFVLIAAIIATAALPTPASLAERAGGRLRVALAYVAGQRAVRALLALWSVGVLFFTLSGPVEVIFAERTLHGGPSAYAALLSAWGAGSVVGSVLYARARQSSSRSLIVLGAAALGAGFIGMSAAPSIVMAAIAAGVAGVGNGIEVVSVRTAVQELLDAERMTIVMTLNDSLTQAATVAGILLGGGLAALFGARAALAVGGVGALTVAGAAWVRLSLVGLTQPLGATEPEGAQPPGGPHVPESAQVPVPAR